MGALAIGALAGAQLRTALRTQGSFGWLADGTRPAILVLWILASLWIPILVYAQMWRMAHCPGSLRFTNSWWSAVFPLGMYSAATQATALQLHLPALVTVSLVFFWIAFTMFVLVAAGWLKSTARLARASPHQR